MTKDLSDQDKALWAHVTDSVKPIAPRRAGTRKAKSQNEKATDAKPRKAPATISRSNIDRPVARHAAAPTTKPPSFNSGFDRATETKLKKGQLEIDGRIDLHGMTQDEAFRALQRFIQSAVRQEKRTLLVITGKGKISTGGTLRRNLPLWLEGNPHILALTPAAAKDGGTGAFYVRLRRKK